MDPAYFYLPSHNVDLCGGEKGKNKNESKNGTSKKSDAQCSVPAMKC